MTLEELKDQNVSAVERAKAVVSALGLKGDERSVVSACQRAISLSW